MEPTVVYREPSGLLSQQVTTVSLPELFAWHRMARQAMAAAAAGDPNAQRDAEAVLELARNGAPRDRGLAVVLAYVLEDAMREVQQQAAAYAAQQVIVESPAPAAEQKPAAPAAEVGETPAPPAPQANVVVDFTGCARPHPKQVSCSECRGKAAA